MSTSKKKTVSQAFVNDFEAVCTRYNLTAEERDEAKAAARNDLENAISTYAALAKESA
jgi:hypothetical protein